jgi:hypothetical protein
MARPQNRLSRPGTAVHAGYDGHPSTDRARHQLQPSVLRHRSIDSLRPSRNPARQVMQVNLLIRPEAERVSAFLNFGA